MEATKSTQSEENVDPIWKLWVDGLSTESGERVRAILEDPVGAQLQYDVRFQFPVSNNVAEYEALIAGLRLAAKSEAEYLEVYSNSKLVANQVSGSFETGDPVITKYHNLVEKAPQQVQKVYGFIYP